MEDFRLNRKKEHQLIDIISIAIAATLCGCSGYDEIEDFGLVRFNWLKTFLELPNGIPSHDTFNRVFSKMDPIKFEECFRNWVSSISGPHKGQLLCIDGKTIRGAKTDGQKSLIHMVSVWASESNLVFGQLKVDEKSNEITAIPEILNSILIENCLISIDAMGCQEAIARTIIDKKGDYILGVKNNQQTLFEDIEDSFLFYKPIDIDLSEDVGHGRVEKRTCSIITNKGHITQPEKWQNLTVLVKIESERYFKVNQKTEKSVRYYIASRLESASFYQQNIRNHWGIENKLHWTLDVVFNEDGLRKRAGHAAQNFSIINKIAVNIARNEKTKTCSINRKRRFAAMDLNYLEVLMKF